MNNDKVKCKVFSYTESDYCYECRHENNLQGITPWEELTEGDYNALEIAVNHANSFHKSQNKYIIIRQIDQSDFGDIFATAKQYVNYVNKEKKKREERANEQKKRKIELSLTRKQKQLEKLKKELGHND